MVRAGAGFYLAVLFLAVFFVGPFVWAVISSFKDAGEVVAASPPTLFPKVWGLDHYARAWAMVPFLGFYINSVIVTGLAVLGQTLTATLVAYGFARYRFPYPVAVHRLARAALLPDHPHRRRGSQGAPAAGGHDG